MPIVIPFLINDERQLVSVPKTVDDVRESCASRLVSLDEDEISVWPVVIPPRAILRCDGNLL